MAMRSYCWIAISLVSASGCTQYLVATPNLLQRQDAQHVYAGIPKERQTPTAQVLYVTDRTVVPRNGEAPGDSDEMWQRAAALMRRDEAPAYGFGRSPKLAYGVANVGLNPHPSWQELIQESTRPQRVQEYELKLAGVRELGHFKSHMNEPNPAIAQATAREEPFRALLRERLAQTDHKDVFIFIHGYNNTFDEAIFRTAEVWHFMGRVGVPITYSWPAGRGGIRGYAYDRESGEFTVSHLREFIKNVAACPEVERIHLIGHSRGTDVTISALRELNLHFRAQGKSTQAELKLENVVLAAPDVDEEVFIQRCVGENLLDAARRTTIYISQHDKVIEVADLVFASRGRLGTLAAKDVNPKMRQKLAAMPNVQIIECKVSGWTLTHSYVFTHPAALSDLILVLRDRRPPGAEHGRPLRQPAAGFWELTDDYLAK